MNGYELSRQWFDWSYEHPELNSPTHAGFMFWLIELNNRLGWKEKFGLPTLHTMEVLNIRSYKTYKGILDDLIDWGFVKLHQKATNNHTSNIIELVKFTISTTNSLNNSLPSQLPTHDSLIDILTVDIEKQENKETSKQENTETVIEIEFEKFKKSYPGSKRGFRTEFENLKKKHKDYIKVVAQLNENLERQIRERVSLRFKPEWPNLQTYINNRRWETIYQEEKSYEKRLSERQISTFNELVDGRV